MGTLFMLEVDVGSYKHGAGGAGAHRPWVARIDGPDPKYGLSREFIKPYNDWEHARRSINGAIRGVVARFPLRRGQLYEVSRLQGRASKRQITRTFGWLGDVGDLEQLEPEDALDKIGGLTNGVTYRTDDDDETATVGEVRGLGHPATVPWIVVEGTRLYRLGEGRVYAHEDQLLGIRDSEVVELDQLEAWEWLQKKRNG